MVKKHFTLRLTAVSCLTFLSLFLASFSCQDHEPDPLVELAEISTQSISINPQPTTKIEFRLLFTKLGNVNILEYGMLCVFKPVADPGPDPVPQLSDEKFVFTKPIILNEQIIAEFDHAPVVGSEAFYRAYVILENGTFVFGNVLSGD